MLKILPTNLNNGPINPIQFLYSISPKILALTTLITTLANQTLVQNPDSKKGKLQKLGIYFMTSSWIGIAALALGSSIASVGFSVALAAGPILFIDKMLYDDFFDEDDNEFSSKNSSSQSSSEVSSRTIKKKKVKKTSAPKLRETILRKVKGTDQTDAVSISSQEFSSFLKNTYGEDNSGFWMGTTQKDSSAIQLLIDHMKELKDQGVEVIYLPFLPHQNNHFELELLNSCEPQAKISPTIRKSFEKIVFNGLSLLDLCKEAKKQDIYLSLTHGNAKFKEPDSDWLDHRRINSCGKYIILDIIQDDKEILNQQKKGYVPLAHDLKIPSILTEPSQRVKSLKIKSGKDAQSLNISGKLLIP